MGLVDSHCHLDTVIKENIELSEILTTAKENNVDTMLSVTTTKEQWDKVEELTAPYDHIFMSIGTHPLESNGGADDISVEEITTRVQNGSKKIIAIGESGLDFFHEGFNKEKQMEAFRIHIQSARKLDLPVIVHTREAEEETLQVLKEEHEIAPFKGVIHCFTASREFMEEAVKLGMYISISGIVTFKNAKKLAKVVKDIPLDRLLVETDAPFLAPKPFRGETNLPAYTYHTASCIATLRDMSFEEIAEVTTNNFFRLFDKATRP